MNESNLFLYAEGHPNAFGAGILEENLSSFIEYSNNVLKDFDFTPCYLVDFIYSNNNLKTSDVLEIASLKNTWGQGVDESLVAIENISISADNIRLMAADKNPTLKITLPNGISLIKFKSSIKEYESLNKQNGRVIINVIGKCECNIWNGRISPQLIIEDYEIISCLDYYF